MITINPLRLKFVHM